jgi:hypothetical protein
MDGAAVASFKNNLPRPENAAPAAALMLVPRERKCLNRKRG